MSRRLGLVVCGAPLASRTLDLWRALVDAGWDVDLAATPAALGWLDTELCAEVTGRPVVTEPQSSVVSRSSGRPEQVVVCPITFNSVSKLVLGLADTYAAGVLCDALGAGTPMHVVPMVNDRLWGHPVWSGRLRQMRAWGVRVIDPRTGSASSIEPVSSGTGAAVVERFDPRWAVPRPRP